MRLKAVSIRLSVSTSTSPNRLVCRQHLNRPPASLKKMCRTLDNACAELYLCGNFRKHT